MCRIPPVQLRRFLGRLRDRPGLQRIVFEGDSWFSYPGLRGGNLYSRLSRRYARHAASLQMAEPGDRAASVLDGCQHRLLRLALEEWTPAVLAYSGGGNDVIGEHLVDLVKPAADPQAPRPPRFAGLTLPPVATAHLRLDRLDRTLLGIELAYQTVLDLRDDHAPHCQVVTHCYDYARASGIGFTLGPVRQGPWIRPAFDAVGVPAAGRAALVRFLVDEFARALANIALSRSAFTVIDSRGVLPDDEWADEIHPSAAGCRRLIATSWAPVLDPMLGRS